MNQRGYASAVKALPVEALIIQADGTYEVRQVDQDLATYRGIVGGYIEPVDAEGAILWCNEEAKIHGLPTNLMATFLWWQLNPDMEGLDELRGTVMVTGPADEAGDSTPILPPVLDHFRKMVAIKLEREHQGPETPTGHAP
jgi:hypothetical protein